MAGETEWKPGGRDQVPLDEPHGCGPLICGVASAVTGVFYASQIHFGPPAPHPYSHGTWPAMPSGPMICLGLVLLLVNVVGGAVAVIGGALSLRRGIQIPAYRSTGSAVTTILLGLIGWAGLIALFLFDH